MGGAGAVKDRVEVPERLRLNSAAQFQPRKGGLVGRSRPEQVIGTNREADYEHDQQRQRQGIAQAATVPVTQVMSATRHTAVKASACDRR